LKHTRRGNSLILVTALLVLLVIIASAYITRVQSSRITGSATQRLNQREDIANSVADNIALEISEHLFVRPVDGIQVKSNTPRLPIPFDTVRYAPAESDLLNGIRFNLPPFEVIPWTNWPDAYPAIPATQNFPGGATGQATLNTLGIGEADKIGEPGFGDTRWLCDTEPVRWQLPGPDGTLGNVDDYPVFGQWRHMSYIPRPNNGWRLCYDISNVDSAILDDLSIPVEQFLALRPGGTGGNAAVNTATGLPRLPNNFIPRVVSWFSNSYATVYTSPIDILPNFVRLSDLDGDGIKFNDPRGDLPSQEFEPGTARWAVGTALCDTDGDGFTDSFWFLAPSSVDRGIRTIVGMRIVDNGGMANVNVASAFTPGDGFFGTDIKTKGTTPADLALVGEQRLINALQATNPTLANWNVGLFDFPGNWSRFPLTNYFSGLSNANSLRYWQQHLGGLGMPVQANGRPNQANRLNWWLNVGVEGPYTPTPQFGFAPYTAADELELRMFNGNNSAWSLSRLEHTTQLTTSSSGTGGNNYGRFLLRGEIDREESAELLDRLDNRELVGDMRRKITTFNATRNDLLPAWLWPANWATDIRLRQKVDLRAYQGDYDRNGITNDIDREYLYDVIRRALHDEVSEQTYYGNNTPTDDIPRAERMAGHLAANIQAYADQDFFAPLDETIVVNNDNNYGLLGEFRAYGMERQPFLVEAMVGHVYKGEQALRSHPDNGNGAIVAGDNVVCADSERSTFVVVQIANPYSEAIMLDDPREHYELEVFGQSLNLAPNPAIINPVNSIPSSSYAAPRTLTIIAIENDLDGDPLKAPWLRFLNLDDPNTILIELPTTGASIPWSVSRGVYDGGPSAPGMTPNIDDGIQLVRVVSNPSNPGGTARVIIDRFNDPSTPRFSQIGGSLVDGDPSFASVTGRLGNQEPGGDCSSEPGDGIPWPGVRNINTTNVTATHWIQWSHVTRAWGTSAEMRLRSPRYVFANRISTRGDNEFSYDTTSGDVIGITAGDPTEWTARFGHGNYAGNGYPDKEFDGNQSGENLEFAFQMLQKDDEFEQLGELLNVFTHGHLLLFSPGVGYTRTLQTFSEYLQENLIAGPPEANVRVCRLDPFRPDSGITGDPVVNVVTPLPPLPPALPAAMRVLEAFVCDGAGLNATPTVGVPFRLANAFTGRPVHGLINLNTAPMEVLRMLPHMTRILNEAGIPSGNGGFSVQPRVGIPEAIVQAREAYNGSMQLTGPPYRNGIPDGVDYQARGKRGFNGIGELLLLNGQAPNDILEFNQLILKQEAWDIEFAAKRPFEDATTPPIESAYLSTDVVQPAGLTSTNVEGDGVAADAEEYNLLFSGLSSLVTTRSDTFTVYFKVRSFRQNPVTGVWNATDPEFIVDDSRYVMLVDRSNVNSPTDKPRILYMEKLPN